MQNDFSHYEKVLEGHRKLIFWQFHRAGIQEEDTEEVLAEVNLYVTEQWHRYDPSQSSPSTFLFWQVKGAIRRWQRRELRYYQHVEEMISDDDEEYGDDPLETIIDQNQADGRDIEEQIVMRATLLKTLQMAEDQGIKIDLDRPRVHKKARAALQSIWLDISSQVIDK